MLSDSSAFSPSLALSQVEPSFCPAEYAVCPLQIPENGWGKQIRALLVLAFVRDLIGRKKKLINKQTNKQMKE